MWKQHGHLTETFGASTYGTPSPIHHTRRHPGMPSPGRPAGLSSTLPAPTMARGHAASPTHNAAARKVAHRGFAATPAASSGRAMVGFAVGTGIAMASASHLTVNTSPAVGAFRRTTASPGNVERPPTGFSPVSRGLRKRPVTVTLGPKTARHRMQFNKPDVFESSDEEGGVSVRQLDVAPCP